jgi:hypothetical protein
LAVSICMPFGALQAIATQEDSATTALEETVSSTDSTESTSTTSAITDSEETDSSSDSTSDTSSEETTSTVETDSTTTTTDTSSSQASVQSLVATATTTGASGEVYATITGFEIQQPLGTEVSTIEQGSAFYLVIDWTASNSGETLQEGDYFDITLPDTLYLPSSITDYSFDITDDDGNAVGTVTITPGDSNIGGTVRTVFNSAVSDSTTVAGTFNIQVLANESEFTLGEATAITISATSSSTTTSTASANLTIEEVTLTENEVLGKWGAMDEDYEGLAEWAVRINYGQSVSLSDVIITDTLSDGDGTEQYVPELFLFVKVTYDSSGGWDWVEEPIDITDLLTFSDDYRSFTLDLSSLDLGTDQYLLLYRTTYNTSGTTLSNSVIMNATVSSAAMTWTATDTCTSQSSSGSVDVILPNTIEIIKVDAEDSAKTLSGVEFTATDADGNTYTLTTDEDGIATLGDLASGTYTVKEVAAPTNYELNETEYTAEVSSSGVAVLAIADEPVTTSIPVTKKWIGAAADSVTVHLLADGVDTGKTLVLTEGNDWTETFEARTYNTSGEEITYTVEEDAIDDYTTTISDYNTSTGYIITNTNTSTVDVSGTVAWDDSDDQDGVRPDSVTVNLLQDGTVVDTQTVTADDDGTWSFSFADWAMYDSTSGSEYTYTVSEDAVTAYTAAVTGSVSAGFTITNTHETETTSVSVTKSWVGPAGTSATFALYADGADTGQTLTITADDGWTGSFDGLDKYANGNEIAYTVSETAMGGVDSSDYSTTVSGDASDGYVVTNTNTETVDVSGTVAWDDSDDQDEVRPDSVTVNLLQDGEVVDTALVEADTDGTWSFSFADLAKYDSDGNEYIYTVSEGAVTDYTTAVTGSVSTGFTITNTHETETTSVSVSKTWDDNDDQGGTRPDSVTVQLYADGAVYGDAVELSDDNGWAYTWTGLDAYSDGEATTYTVEETDVPDGYTSTVTGDAGSGFTITNTHEPETAEASSGMSGTPSTGDEHPVVPLVLVAASAATIVAASLVRHRSPRRDEGNRAR